MRTRLMSYGWKCFRLALLLGAAVPLAQARADEARTIAYFDQIHDQPVPLGIFLRQMPKGGDLHNHIDGAVYAESFLNWASNDKLCVSKADLAIVAPPCKPAAGIVPAAQALQDGRFYQLMVDALSMKDFVPTEAESGHDHFFATFAKFSPATVRRAADVLAEVANRAGAENTSYLELLWSPGMNDAATLAGKLPFAEDKEAALREKLAPQFLPVIKKTQNFFDQAEAGMRQLLHCDTPQAEPGCRVTIRYQAKVIWVRTPAEVYGQILYGYMLAHSDPRVVGVNLVAAEDTPVALRDYRLHMRVLAQMNQWYPDVHLSLHAGELTMGLVPPEDLRFHIHDAVEVAGAQRIGHGVDIMYEDNARELMADMARRHVMVEINLTSNDVILGVTGDAHPFQTYRAAGVPMALSTDDEGVSRIDLTHEYTRAVNTYHLRYPDLKLFARNSLQYAFLSGASIWQSTSPYRPVDACAKVTLGADVPSGPCHDLIASSDRARAQWALEASFAKFEATKW